MAQVFRFADGMDSDYEGEGNSLFDRMVEDLDLSEKDLKYKHVTGVSSDYSLCGLAYGEYVEAEHFKSGRITCPKCLEVISYCKKFKAGKDYLTKNL